MSGIKKPPFSVKHDRQIILEACPGVGMNHRPVVCHVNLAKGFRGGERQTQILIGRLAEAGIRQLLVARKDSPLHKRLTDTEGLVHIPVSKPYLAAMPVVARLNPSLIHAHDAKAAQWAMLNRLLRHTPYLITRRVPNPLGKNFFTRAVYRNAAVVVALSHAIRYSIRELLPTLDVKIIPSMYASLPVDSAGLARLRARYQRKFLIGHIGALVNRHKGQAVIIEAARQLAHSHPDIHFVLLGEGEDEQWLKSLAEGLPNIEFAGFVADIGNWIAAFDLFVFPSFQEGLGSTLLDVMQSGCPIIASATDGILDVIEHEVNGLLISAGQSEKLAAAVERLYSSPELRREFAETGRQRLALYSPEHIAGKYLELYQSLPEVNGS